MTSSQKLTINRPDSILNIQIKSKIFIKNQQDNCRSACAGFIHIVRVEVFSYFLSFLCYADFDFFIGL